MFSNAETINLKSFWIYHEMSVFNHMRDFNAGTLKINGCAKVVYIDYRFVAINSQVGDYNCVLFWSN